MPTPFVNLALCRDAEGTSARVLACNKEVLVETSTIPMSYGDEPGTLGGVFSGVNIGPATFKSSSGRVYAEGKHVIILTSRTGQNGTPANAMGRVETRSQGKVLAGA
jgi:hypothetical protein